jgi:signal recognition particle subunit SRP54
MDGDTRGGAALSVRRISGQPIKFIGIGEKVDALQPFYPDRMASRILGMGDVLTLVEKAREEVDMEEAEKMQEKILSAKFDFTDFLKQTRLLKNMGSLGGVMKLIPGMGKMVNEEQLQKGEEQLKKAEAMIGSMTTAERKDPDLLANSPSRRKRIAKGSGHSDREVSELVSNFQRMRSMMQQMGSGQMGLPGMGGPMGGLPNPFGGGGNPFGGMGGGMRPPQPGFRGYQGGGKKKKGGKDKKKKGFGNL